jgi:hypothetical protein
VVLVSVVELTRALPSVLPSSGEQVELQLVIVPGKLLDQKSRVNPGVIVTFVVQTGVVKAPANHSTDTSQLPPLNSW